MKPIGELSPRTALWSELRVLDAALEVGVAIKSVAASKGAVKRPGELSPRTVLFSDRGEAVRKAVEKLPFRKDLSDEERRHQVFYYAYFLAFGSELRFLDAARGVGVAIKSLARIQKLSAELAGEIDQLPLEAGKTMSFAIAEVNALRGSEIGPPASWLAQEPLLRIQHLAASLRVYYQCAQRAQKSLEEEQARKSQEVVEEREIKRGRRPKTYATCVAWIALETYRQLTGERLTRRTRMVPVNADQQQQKAYGQLHDFVADIFKALGIKASAEVHLRKAASPPLPKPARRSDAAMRLIMEEIGQ